MQWKDQRMSTEDEAVEFEEFWSERRENLSREIEEKWEKIVRIQYIESHNSQQIETCWEVSSIKRAPFICRRAIQDLSRGVHNEGSSMDRGSCWEAIEQTEGFSMDRSSYRECDKKQLKSLDR